MVFNREEYRRRAINRERIKRSDVTGSYVAKSYINWGFVRAFGELQILTRVSYSMLLLVPLLAAMWPVVGEGIRYFETFFATNGVPEQVSHDGERSSLPSVWVVAFFSALASVAAGTLYQIAAPSIIKEYSLREFIDAEAKRLSENPTEAQLNVAIDILHGLHLGEPNENRRVPTFLRIEANHLLKIWEAAKAPPSVNVPGSKISIQKEGSKIVAEVTRDVINLAAEIQYNIKARERRAVAQSAGILYMVTIAGILWITVTQSANVLMQADWL